MTTTSTTNDHDPGDELAMPHFEEQLWAEIRAHHEDGAWARPAATTGRDRVPATVAGPPALHRRAARRSLAAAAALAVIAAAGALSSLGGDDGNGTAAAGEIEAKTIAAIDAALADSVVHTVQTSGDDVWEVWYDETTHTSRAVHRHDRDGTLLSEVGPTVAPTPDGPPSADVASRQINYCRSEYADVASMRVIALVLTEPETIRDQLLAGDFFPDGTEVVDGRELIRLVDATPAASSRELVYYVDPDTYRPMLVRTSPAEGEPAGAPSLVAETITVEYLPRTAENLSQLAPAIPEGFTQVTDTGGLGFVFFDACD